MTEIWAQYARYNRLANETLYAACAGLSGAEYRRDLGAFFGSVHGTLNHLLVGDTIWMARFEGGSHPSTNLDAILFERFDALREARADGPPYRALFLDLAGRFRTRQRALCQ
jgi:uncharacterized damage-inducible protein DinB